jgi:hypothetical protein
MKLSSTWWVSDGRNEQISEVDVRRAINTISWLVPTWPSPFQNISNCLEFLESPSIYWIKGINVHKYRLCVNFSLTFIFIQWSAAQVQLETNLTPIGNAMDPMELTQLRTNQYQLLFRTYCMTTLPVSPLRSLYLWPNSALLLLNLDWSSWRHSLAGNAPLPLKVSLWKMVVTAMCLFCSK